ncbi:MAG: extracellular solute-binding protein [Actinobacteria bacterium]|nr:extracellular solute-binding protein [Actinomycetota bacterium]
MRLKRGIRLVLAGVLAVALLSACGPKSDEKPGTKPADTAKPVEIVHWQHHHEGRSPVLQELIDEFQAKHKNIIIKTEKIPYDTYFDKLVTSLGAKNGPDVFQIPQTMMAEMLNGGLLAPLPESVLSAKEAQEKFVPWTMEQLIKDGKVYGVPTDVQTLVMFINNDLAKAAGLDPSKPPKTWSELETWTKKATRKDANGIVQAGLDTRYKWAVYNLFLVQALGDKPVVDFAGKKVNYDGPEGMAAWKLVEDLMVKAGVDSPKFLTGQQKFEQKKAVIYINHPVTRGRLDKLTGDAKIDFSVHLPPAKDGEALRVPGNSWAYVLNKDSKNAQAAEEWIKFLASKEAIKKWALKAGDLPALKELLTDTDIAKDETSKVGLESMKYAVPVRQTGGKDVDDIRAEIWDNIVIKGMKVEEAVKAGAEKENALIARKLKK